MVSTMIYVDTILMSGLSIRQMGWPDAYIELAIDQVQRAWSGGIGLRRSDLLASAGSFKPKLSHQALHGTAGNWQTFPVHLFPDFDDPVDLPVGMPDTLDIIAAQPGEVSLSNPAPVT